ncbi:pyridoxal-phosphate dependent enzyme [Streptomyces sp. SL13]|jgi:L-cysteate sulfo-lyase|uniref:Pyridoxal-phosphate dependent enzyme n=1 Tax=Streptantibioticus silvisoli TaxID=2705255 RepID=A0AA90GW63_9ACTN|nr:pyridoxal-phosphate dependent enzyme [Streptantibioticus silvisoli]MDI5969213.1 pyridoxal-phosphate dependent enzyme [Streptantibioticus silvisoli]
MTNADGTAPRAPLSSWPTPLEPAARLGLRLGLGPDDLWIKRDDLTGLGGGGNKVRKLEFTCGQALAAGATTLVTCGAPQSNHARLTAAAAARLGLDAVLVLAADPGVPHGGNLALDGLFGARVVWAGPVGEAELGARTAAVADELRAGGEIPALVPFGGSSPLGALGYARCARELLTQAPDLDTVVVALGSGGTMAGLVSVLGAHRVLGVHCGAVEDPAGTVGALLSGMAGPDGGHPDAGELRVRHDQVGAGYPVLTEPVMAALTLAARTEGVVLDPVYTGRAMAGLIAAVRDGDVRPGHRTVFLHTGGLPGLFGHPDTLARAAEDLTGR